MINNNDDMLILRNSEALRKEVYENDEDQLLENPLLDDILLDNLMEDSPLMPNTERNRL